jgi:hypothetical protein
MKTSHSRLKRLLLASAVCALPLVSQAGTITFAEYDGLANNAAIPIAQLPEGLPDGVTASWVGFLLHTEAGDTPMSVFPDGDRAVLSFSPPVIVSSINAYDTDWGDPVTIIGSLHGIEVWRYDSPGDHLWQKLTMGAGKVVDSIAFVGKWNHYDDLVVEPAPDTDGDGFVDADEDQTGHDKADANNNPTASAIADSVVQFNGNQGENGWFYGYRNVSKDGGGVNYDPSTGFIEFAADAWTGGGWDLNTAAAAPWTELGTRNTHPNAGTGDTEWTVRRWVADSITKVTPLAFRWHTHHVNVTCGGNGVTGALYRNGQLLESVVIPGVDSVGVTHTYYVNVNPGDKFDLTLSAKGTDGIEIDGCDGSENWLLVDPTIPSTPKQPDGSIFVPAGTGDTDGDGLPDVWEKIFFPTDLTKLSAAGDYDKDGLNDKGEYDRGSDPTKPDTDGDGLSDAVETNTGKFVSKTDTGSNPAKKDSDGDGLTDDIEVNRTPATDPNKADTDGDTWSDPDEISWGTNPTDKNDTPTTYVIANSQTDFSGTQGQKDWYFGYRVYDPTAGVTNYNANADFVPFPGGDGKGDWDGVNQTWSGTQWDLNTGAAGPWTEEGPLNVHPNGVNSPPTIDGSADPANEQWVTRRWVAKQLTKDTPATIIWLVKKTNLNGTGVSGLLFINGTLVDIKGIQGNDGTGEIRRYKTTLKPNDIVDLALSPAGPTDDRQDGSDGSQTWFWVDTRAQAAPAPTISGVTASGGKFSFKWTSQAGVKYSVMVTTDMKTWTKAQDVDSAGTETSYSENLGSGVGRFFRVMQP